ncbi:MAG: hypothetical protein ACRCUY_07850 [Thermoguttaceae bacterium]
MSKQFRKTNRIEVTLFPFLAVLLCTMGALIMLLVVIARNVREQVGTPEIPVVVEETANGELTPKWTSEEAAKLLSQIKSNHEEADWYAENYEKSKKEAEAKRAAANEKLAALESESQKIKEEIERLLKLAEQFAAGARPESTEELKQILETKKKERLEAELELAELQKQTSEAAKSYSVVPFRGKDGSFRRPIYVECVQNRLIIQPEGIVLDSNDLLFAGKPDSPFDALLRVIRQYYVETNQVVRGVEPYPLLIVRPSGVDVYGAACHSIGSWMQEYGYELVDEDWKLQYTEPSDELRDRLEKQLSASRTRMISYLAAIKSQQQVDESGRAIQYRVDSSGAVQPTENMAYFRNANERRFRESERAKKTGYSPTTGHSASEANSTTSESFSDGAFPALQSALPLGATANNVIGNNALKNNVVGGNNVVGENNVTGNNFDTNSAELQNEIPASNSSTKNTFEQFGTKTAEMAQNAGKYPDTAGKNDKTKSSKNTDSSEISTANSANPASSANPLRNQSKATKAENWGLRDADTFSAGVSRNVKILCESDKFIIPKQMGSMETRVVPIINSKELAVDQLVKQIWEFMDSWGSAGDKMYWRPVLQVTVIPGGEKRFQELQQMLRGSGLVIEERREN